MPSAFSSSRLRFDSDECLEPLSRADFVFLSRTPLAFGSSGLHFSFTNAFGLWLERASFFNSEVKLRDTKPFYLRRLTYFLALCAVCR
jgi:hypothetical protein